MKLAIVGASHWHVPLYEPGFAKAGARLVAAWDENADAASTLAGRHGARAYDSLDALLDADIDLAFVFGSPAAMPGLAKQVIVRGLPFSLEKPCGLTAADVAGIRAAADAASVYAAVPFVQRFSPLGRQLLSLAEQDPAFDVSFRFIAGPPERYERTGCGWALDPALGGGGPVINLAVHFVDLAIQLTGSPARSVFARTSNLMHRRAVEDRGTLSIAHENGALTTIEVGYRFPDGTPAREYRLSMIGRSYYAETEPENLIIRSPSGSSERVPMSFDSDTYYTHYVVRVIEDVAQGLRPLVGLKDMQFVMEVVDAAYASARTGEAICI